MDAEPFVVNEYVLWRNEHGTMERGRVYSVNDAKITVLSDSGVTLLLMDYQLSRPGAKKSGHGMDLETENLITILEFLRTQMAVHAPQIYDATVWDAFERRWLEAKTDPDEDDVHTPHPHGPDIGTADQADPVALHNAKPGEIFASVYRGEQFAVRALEEIRIGDRLQNGTDDKGYSGVILCDRDEAAKRASIGTVNKMAFMDEAVGLPDDYWQKLSAFQPGTCKSLLAGHEPGCPHSKPAP